MTSRIPSKGDGQLDRNVPMKSTTSLSPPRPADKPGISRIPTKSSVSSADVPSSSSSSALGQRLTSRVNVSGMATGIPSREGARSSARADLTVAASSRPMRSSREASPTPHATSSLPSYAGMTTAVVKLRASRDPSPAGSLSEDGKCLRHSPHFRDEVEERLGPQRTKVTNGVGVGVGISSAIAGSAAAFTPIKSATLAPMDVPLDAIPTPGSSQKRFAVPPPSTPPPPEATAVVSGRSPGAAAPAPGGAESNGRGTTDATAAEPGEVGKGGARAGTEAGVGTAASRIKALVEGMALARSRGTTTILSSPSKAAAAAADADDHPKAADSLSRVPNKSALTPPVVKVPSLIPRVHEAGAGAGALSEVDEIPAGGAAASGTAGPGPGPNASVKERAKSFVVGSGATATGTPATDRKPANPNPNVHGGQKRSSVSSLLAQFSANGHFGNAVGPSSCSNGAGDDRRAESKQTIALPGAGEQVVTGSGAAAEVSHHSTSKVTQARMLFQSSTSAASSDSNAHTMQALANSALPERSSSGTAAVWPPLPPVPPFAGKPSAAKDDHKATITSTAAAAAAAAVNDEIPTTVPPAKDAENELRKPSAVASAIAAVQSKSFGMNEKEKDAAASGQAKAKAAIAGGNTASVVQALTSMGLRSSADATAAAAEEQPTADKKWGWSKDKDREKGAETALPTPTPTPTPRPSRAAPALTLLDDDIPTVDEPQPQSQPQPQPPFDTAARTAAPNKLAAFLRATATKDVALQQAMQQGEGCGGGGGDPIPTVAPPSSIPTAAGGESAPQQSKPSVVLSAISSLLTKGVQGSAELPFWKRQVLAQQEEKDAAANDGQDTTDTAASIPVPSRPRIGRLSMGVAARARTFDATSTDTDTGTSDGAATTTAGSAAEMKAPRRRLNRLSLAQFGLAPENRPDAGAKDKDAAPIVNPNPSGIAAARAMFASKPLTAPVPMPNRPMGSGALGFLPPAKSRTPTLTQASAAEAEPQDCDGEYYDDRLVLDDPENCPLLYIEVGSYETRMGVWNSVENHFELRFTCPSYVAVAKNDKNRYDLVSGAGRMCDPMYETFRETGVFVGNDAKYCLYEHPDAGLRGGLELQHVLVDGRIGHKMGFLMLIHHCLFRGLGLEDAYNKEMQLVFAIKMSFSRADLSLIAECIFERLGCTKACFFSEASLAADAHQAQYSPLKDLDSFPEEAKGLSLELYSSTSAVVVDIGAHQTTVCPMYEGIIMPSAVQSCSVGGEHCTDFMELLLGAQHSETFSSLLPRRKKLISRQIKEQFAFVAPSFTKAVEEYGSFRFDSVRLPKDALVASARVANVHLDGPKRSRRSKGQSSATATDTITSAATTKSSDATMSQDDNDHGADTATSIASDEEGEGVWKISGGGEGDTETETAAAAPSSTSRGDDKRLDQSLDSQVDATSEAGSDLGDRSAPSSPSRRATKNAWLRSQESGSSGSGGGSSSPSHAPRGETIQDHISRADAKMAFQKFIKGKSRYLHLSDQACDDTEEQAAGAISVPAAQPLTVMNVRRVYNSPLPNGTELTLSVDKERFHCCEVLFQPNPINADTDEGCFCRDNSIVNTILRAVEAVDASVRPDICARIIVFGRTALVPGLLLRLREELRDRLCALGVAEFVIAGTEEPPRGPADDGDDDELMNSAHDGVTIFGSRASSFAPSASWRGASERVKWSRDFPIVTQSIMTDTDYHEFGPHVIEDFLAGIM